MLAGIPACAAMLQYPLYGLAHRGNPPIQETLGLVGAAGVLMIVATLARSPRPGPSDLLAVALGMLAGCAGSFGVIAGYIVARMMLL
jgi:hypothetical protein